VLKLKKRHVELVTRLPTERLATACWDFIVAKSPPSEPAPVLVFEPLRSANSNFCPQDINRLLSAAARISEVITHKGSQRLNASRNPQILDAQLRKQRLPELK
jgi:hypothetical protein